MFEIFSGIPTAAKAILALVIVIALIALVAWLVRRFASNRLGGGNVRGRQPRLAVIDAANVDARRRLILIRRDNIEHLLMIGGPSDIVVEPNIVRAGAAREPARESGARMPAGDNGWPLQPLNEPPVRGRDEWTPPESPPARARSSDPLAGLTSDFSSRMAAPDVPPIPRREPRAVPPAPPPPLDPAADQNLADMANQLEAALRAVPEPRAPMTETLAQAVTPKAPEPLRPPREIKMRIDPRIEATPPKPEFKPEPRPEPKLDMPDVKIEPRVEPKFEAMPEPKPRAVVEPPKAEPQADAKTAPKPDPLSRQDFYDNLEEEMASLLGRPSGKS
jgi:hypothetical protein